MNKVRPIAFYLPQYHPTVENDFYWGQGFTEWTNVTKGSPAYVGHYQPQLPADLGFYDLRVKETVERQASLARRYGISGFCIYYYNFGRRRALDQAFEAIVADPPLPVHIAFVGRMKTGRAIGMAETGNLFSSRSMTGAPCLELSRMQRVTQLIPATSV